MAMQIFILVRARRASLVPRVFKWEFAKNCVLYEVHVSKLDCFLNLRARVALKELRNDSFLCKQPGSLMNEWLGGAEMCIALICVKWKNLE